MEPKIVRSAIFSLGAIYTDKKEAKDNKKFIKVHRVEEILDVREFLKA